MKELQSLDDIFNKKIFRIPDYQRGYAWGEKQLVDFWEDLLNLDGHRLHYTGVLSIKQVPKESWSNWNDECWLIEKRRHIPYFIVDGQQRLTTVSIFLQCLVETVKQHPDNAQLNDKDILLGTYTLSDIIEKYIVVEEPPHHIIKSYKFGYEVDNPSFTFMRHKIFNEPHGGSINETFYTLNLENAKKFFLENINEIVNAQGLSALEDIYEKLTQRFMFNLYEIDDNFDVFVAFETMNNRGKKLSDLELLKNRLIYLTTLYDKTEVAQNVQDAARKNINDTWGEIYHQLGKNKKKPLNDDEFLKAHWIMYFKYSRKKGNDYIRYLLDDYFSPKQVFEKTKVSTKDLEMVEELIDEDINDGDDVAEDETPYNSDSRSKLQITEINDYVNSLKGASEHWYNSFFPENNAAFSSVESVALDRLNRLGIGYFRPLVMSCFAAQGIDATERVRLLNEIERFIFISSRVSRAISTYGSSEYYRAAREVYKAEKNINEIIESLDKSLSWVFEDDGAYKYNYFKNFISKKFASGGEGFYAWNGLRYFLYEYEENLMKSRNQPKVTWQNFIKGEKDKVSIEHIYPQTATSEYWLKNYKCYTKEQCKYLNGSLGNLLPLSSSVNSSLQNDDFPDKKNLKHNKDGKVSRNGYSNGSYSELEVADKDKWTNIEIKERGLHLLAFMEVRWKINFGSEENKLEILHLNFIDKSTTLTEESDKEVEK